MSKKLNGLGRREPRAPRPDLTSLILPPHLELEHALVHTPSFKNAATAMTSLLKRNRIGLIDGEPGTGKTTFAQWAAEQCGRPSAIAVMPDNPAPNDLLRIAITAVTGHNPGGDNKPEMEAELASALSEWQGLLILDEVQNVRIRGLTEARYIHDVTRPEFPMLLVGYGAIEVVKTNKVLSSRVRLRRTFRPLTGEDLFTTVRAIDERFNSVPDDLIRYADDKHGRGNLRAWLDIIEQLQDWEVTKPKRADIDDVVLSVQDVA